MGLCCYGNILKPELEIVLVVLKKSERRSQTCMLESACRLLAALAGRISHFVLQLLEL